MDNRDLWLVNIEQGLGPLVLGALRPRVLDALEAFEVQASFDPYGRESPIRIAQLGIWLVFADDDSQTLRRIDVTNPRVHFATWDVIGKPIHKAVRLFKCAENETLWCKSFEESEQRALSSVDRAKLKVPGDVELLRRGTLWIPALGLGFSLKDGKIDKLHLCKPEHVPKLGTGNWNVAQKTMSEQGRIPHREIRIGVEESRATKSVRTILKVMLVAALGIVVWRAVDLQLKWNALPDTPATVIAIIPPPPAPFGDFFQLQYMDEKEHRHEVTFERMDFNDEPKLNSVVNIRYMPDAPDKPLGDRRFVDVGMNYGLPKVAVIVAVYTVLLLLFEIRNWFRPKLV